MNSKHIKHLLRFLTWQAGSLPLGGLMVKNLPAMQEMWLQSLGQEDPLEKEILQYSCLENSMERGAWQATVQGVTKSQTQLND